jgi:DNA polymerase
MHLVTLAHPADQAGWRAAARALLALGVAPDQATWHVQGQRDETPSLLQAEPLVVEAAPASLPPRVPAAFVDLAHRALLHRDPLRFGLLYRLLWRLLHEPGLRHDSLDSDRMAAEAMAQQVQRDVHKMKAFVRFSEQPDGRFTAWFEPEHHVVEAVAPFFARRFAGMRWALFTPLRSACWDGERLQFGAGARRCDVLTTDRQEALWLTYYESIFNPARLKLETMRQHMPRKYWHNLPEAQRIEILVKDAARRMEAMVEAEPTTARKRRPALPAMAAGDTPRDAAQRCTACPHGAQATQAVWGEGPARAPLMLVGEQPGDDEDLRGRPFVGPAGRLLDRALAEAGIARETLYLTNAVKHFRYELRGKRRMHKTPGQREIEACAGWLDAELAAVQPVALVALGATAARALLGAWPQERLAERLGRWHARPDGRPVLVTWHPAALLRMPAGERARAWPQWVAHLRQLLAVRDGLQGLAPGPDSAGLSLTPK